MLHCVAHSSLPKDESLPKYQPPHVRSVQTKMADTFATNAEHNLENFTSLPQRSNSSSLQQRNQQAPFSNFAFSSKLGRSHIAAQFHSNLGNKEDLSTISRPPQQQTSFQQPEFLKMQPLNENTRDKTLKAELDWKIWKFQRNVKRVLDKMVANNSEDYMHEFYKIIAESRLSQEFKGISEVSIIVKLLLEKVMDGSKFDNVAVRVCTMLRGKMLVSTQVNQHALFIETIKLVDRNYDNLHCYAIGCEDYEKFSNNNHYSWRAPIGRNQSCDAIVSQQQVLIST